ncbi:MAG: DUF6033 family protein [Lachnospiraceae bacterium]|nr:DUF6033 family protein [Lachnospiraceae bacterium]
MTSEFYGVSAYQQSSYLSKTGPLQESKEARAKAAEEQDAAKGPGKVKTTPFKPISAGSSLIPQKTDYGFAVGDVKLSDKAKDYYEQLKSKFHNMDFILVSSDMKEAVKRNAAAYGNVNKTVVLIDEEKIERMATDESFRKKYEGILMMSQKKIEEMKNSLTSSGANVKNFGISVDENGNQSLFATLEKSSDAQKARIEAKQEAKRAQKAAEKKAEAKQAQQERIEKRREERKAEKAEQAEALEKAGAEGTEEDAEAAEIEDPREYVTIRSGSLEELLSKVQSYAYDQSANSVLTEGERMVGQSIDFKG